MASTLDAESGSEIFAGYEAELKLVQADLTQKLDQISELAGEPRKAAIASAERALEEAHELLAQMRLEKQNLPTPARPKINARFRTYESAVGAARAQLKKLISSSSWAGGSNSNRDALFSGAGRYRDDDGDDNASGGMRDAQLEQRQQLLSGTERLERTSDRLKNSRALAIATEQIGASTLADLARQREVIEGTNMRLHSSEGYVDRSVKTLRGMARRMATNRLISIAIITVLILLILAIIYSKFK